MSDVWYSVAEHMDKDPDGIMFENINDINLQFWVDKSLEYEFYNLTSILKKEEQKRNEIL
jgi:hypothetical protein